MNNDFYYQEYGKITEEYVEKELLGRGITKEQIDKFKSSGRCLGCTYQHNECQCAFSGSSHPDIQERIDWVEKLIKENSNAQNREIFFKGFLHSFYMFFISLTLCNSPYKSYESFYKDKRTTCQNIIIQL